MPTRALHACNAPTCRALTARRFCDAHAKAYEARRPSPSRRGYGRTWREIRAHVLAARPLCEECKRAPSVQVDHITALAKGGTNDEANLRAMCTPCHSRKTVAVDGGFGRAKARG